MNSCTGHCMWIFSMHVAWKQGMYMYRYLCILSTVPVFSLLVQRPSLALPLSSINFFFIFSSENAKPKETNLTGSIYGRSLQILLILSWSGKNGYHGKFLFLIGWNIKKIFFSKTVWPKGTTFYRKYLTGLLNSVPVRQKTWQPLIIHVS